MNDVKFEEDHFEYRSNSYKEKGLTGWIIKKGWVKSKQQANMLLIVVAVICFALAAVVVF